MRNEYTSGRNAAIPVKELSEMTLEELWQLFPIVLKPHNPAYRDWYEEEKSSLVTLLRPRGFCRISHIGSTSVAGLIAKPTVDILLELCSGYDAGEIVSLLKHTGWTLMAQNDSAQALDFNKGYTKYGFAEKVYHLHVKPSGDWDELYFRDYLKQHDNVAREYEKLKLQLRERFEHDRDAYTDAKTDFIRFYTKKAREEFGGRYLPEGFACPELSDAREEHEDD